jgi:uridine kinase
MPAWTRDDGTPIDAPGAIAARIRATAPRIRGTRLLAVDGPAGSGKTTLATAVVGALAGGSAPAEEVGAVILHMDDFFEGWSGLDDAVLARVQAQVLRPLSRGEPGRWQRYDWARGAFAEWHDIPDVGVVVLEGCGSGAAALRQYASVLAWIEVDVEERLRRGIARDGPAVESRWRQWMRREDAHFAANRTREHADFRLRSADVPRQA